MVLLLAACHAPPRTEPLPAWVHLPAGPVAVVLADSLYYPEYPDLMVLGRFDVTTRTIHVSRKIRSSVQRDKTFFHELCHALLIDSGLHNVLHTTAGPTTVELLCDAYATARLAERHPQP